eukprot:1159224-Pelagomonas_calceolata.AAC.7
MPPNKKPKVVVNMLSPSTKLMPVNQLQQNDRPSIRINPTTSYSMPLLPFATTSYSMPLLLFNATTFCHYFLLRPEAAIGTRA